MDASISWYALHCAWVLFFICFLDFIELSKFVVLMFFFFFFFGICRYVKYFHTKKVCFNLQYLVEGKNSKILMT